MSGILDVHTTKEALISIVTLKYRPTPIGWDPTHTYTGAFDVTEVYQRSGFILDIVDQDELPAVPRDETTVYMYGSVKLSSGTLVNGAIIKVTPEIVWNYTAEGLTEIDVDRG